MAKYTRDDLDKLIDSDIYLPTRTLWIGSIEIEDGKASGTDEAMAERAIKGLHILDSQNANPITILMYNPGGCVRSGFAIYDAIKSCKSHVTIKCYGECSSMGTVILQAADERILAPHITFLIHIGTSAFPEDHFKNVKSAFKWDIILDDYACDIYLEKIKQKHPEYTRQQLNSTLSFDKYLTAEEAIDLGLADKILPLAPITEE